MYFYEVILRNYICTNGRFNSNKSEQSLAVGFHPPFINHYLANQILCLQIKSKPMRAMIWYLHEQAIPHSGEVVLCRKGSSSLSYISYGFLTQQRRMEFFQNFAIISTLNCKFTLHCYCQLQRSVPVVLSQSLN